MGVNRLNSNRFGKFAFVSLVASVMVASTASAQNAEGNWGAEGRFGSGQSAYLLRWFSPTVSLVLGGGFSSSSTTIPQVNAEQKTNSGSLIVLIRKEWGTGRVHPFIGIGPTLSFNRNTTGPVNGSSVAEQKTTSFGPGGRFEFGGFASVSSAVDLGIVASATAQRVQNKSSSSASTTETKQTSNGFGIGNPQFVIRVRF